MRAHLNNLYMVIFAANFWGSLTSARQIGGRVVNGQNATQGQFPYLVSWWDDRNVHFCGGSIFTETTIITAAHCCDKDWGKWPYIYTKIVAGELDLKVSSGLEQTRWVKSSERPNLQILVLPNRTPNRDKNDRTVTEP